MNKEFTCSYYYRNYNPFCKHGRAINNLDLSIIDRHINFSYIDYAYNFSSVKINSIYNNESECGLNYKHDFDSVEFDIFNFRVVNVNFNISYVNRNSRFVTIFKYLNTYV